MILKANVATVKFGHISCQGLLTETGVEAISIPQANLLISFSASNNVASRDLKRIFGHEFNPSKVKVEGLRQLINCLTLPEFERLLFELALMGNPQAIAISRSLIGLSLKQLWADAFNQNFGEKERQEFLKLWQEVREMARVSHSAFQNSCKRYGYNASAVHDAMTVLIFGDTAEQARAKALVEDTLDPEIGLNHQEDILKMRLLYQTKLKFSNLLKGTWQEKVERACREAQKVG
jgi:hypothetical protein